VIHNSKYCRGVHTQNYRDLANGEWRDRGPRPTINSTTSGVRTSPVGLLLPLRPASLSQSLSGLPRPQRQSGSRRARSPALCTPPPAMSVDTERSSTESSAASGLGYEDTALALTLRLPGSDPGRSSPLAAPSDAAPSPKYARLPLLGLLCPLFPSIRELRGGCFDI
jgi:hypothetical protein